MAISSEFFCPRCNKLWDMEECESCGHVADELLKPVVNEKKELKKTVKEEE